MCCYNSLLPILGVDGLHTLGFEHDPAVTFTGRLLSQRLHPTECWGITCASSIHTSAYLCNRGTYCLILTGEAIRTKDIHTCRSLSLPTDHLACCGKFGESIHACVCVFMYTHVSAFVTASIPILYRYKRHSSQIGFKWKGMFETIDTLCTRW